MFGFLKVCCVRYIWKDRNNDIVCISFKDGDDLVHWLKNNRWALNVKLDTEHTTCRKSKLGKKVILKKFYE